EWQKVYRLRGHLLRSSGSTAWIFRRWCNQRRLRLAIDVACGPAAARCALCAPLPARARAARSDPAPGGDQPPTEFRPVPASQFRRSAVKDDATFSLVAAKDIATAPVRFVVGLRGSAHVARKY